jgi:hypothetical protein
MLPAVRPGGRFAIAITNSDTFAVTIAWFFIRAYAAAYASTYPKTNSCSGHLFP